MGIQYNPRTVTDGLVLALDAGNIKSYNVGISSTTWTDIIGRGNTGTLTNSPTYSSQNGGSIVFNGDTNYVENLAPNLGISGDTSVTLSCWFYNSVNSSDNQALLVYGNGSTGGDSISILLRNLSFYASFNGGLDAVIADNVYALNTWNNVVVTKTPGAINTTTKLYLNGVEQTITSASSSTPSLSSRVVRVARWTDDASPYYFLGGVSAALIYNRALSAAEVLQNYNSLKNRFVTAPVLIPVGPYRISRSVRLNSSDSAYLNRTPSVAGNRKTYTLSLWEKRGALSAGDALFSTVNGAEFCYLSHGTGAGNDNLIFAFYNGSGDVFVLSTTAVHRDPSNWYHIVLSVDTTQATSTDRVKIYVNEVLQNVTGTYPTLNYDTPINNTISHIIGGGIGAYTSYLLSGYLADVHFVDGQALTPSSFTETNSNTGQLVPKFYSGTYGVNGFRLNFSDNSAATAATLGADSSGNGNNWTPNNLSVTAGAGNDSLTDTPTSYGTDLGNGAEVRGNYATLNPLSTPGYTYTNGNLDVSGSTANTYAPATISLPLSGKYYFEYTCTNTAGGNRRDTMGVVDLSKPKSYLSNIANTAVYFSLTGDVYTNGSSLATYSSYTNGDIVQCAFDCTTGKLWFGKSGSFNGSPAAGTGQVTTLTNVGSLAFAVGNQDNTGTLSLSGSVNFGQRQFAYPAPSGFKCLCDTSLPTPTIAKGSSVFDTVLYTGTGSTQTISGLGFSPDFVWIKKRNTSDANDLFDVVRGAGKLLQSNNTGSESGNSGDLLGSFTDNGFSVNTTYLGGTNGSTNNNADTYVAWAWDAGSSTVTNTAGTITSQVRANASAGFSVVTYTGNATAGATVGHGLNITPLLVISKSRSITEFWNVYHASLGASQILSLNTVNAANSTNDFNNVGPTSSVLRLGSGTGNNGGGATYVAYCFAPVTGYSSFGSYTGNGSTDGSFTYLGFLPKLILIKRTDTTGNWVMLDSKREGYNVDNDPLYANLNNAEGTDDLVDITSNGFKLRSTNADCNASGGTYIYAAFAENPFQYSRAR